MSRHQRLRLWAYFVLGLQPLPSAAQALIVPQGMVTIYAPGEPGNYVAFDGVTGQSPSRMAHVKELIAGCDPFYDIETMYKREHHGPRCTH